MSVAENNPWPHIGQMFLEQGRINRDQLESALAAQRDTGERLGEILVARGHISRVDLASAIGAQWAYEEPQAGEAAVEPMVVWEAQGPVPVAPVAVQPVAAEPFPAELVAAEVVPAPLVETSYAITGWPEIESAPPAPPVVASADQADLWPPRNPAPVEQAPVEQPVAIAYTPPVPEVALPAPAAPAPLPPPTTWPPAAEIVAQEIAPEVLAPEPVALEPVALEPVALEPVALEPVAPEPVIYEVIAQEPGIPAAAVAEVPVRPAPAESDERVLGDLQLRLRSVYEQLAASEPRLATLESLVRELTHANAALKTQLDAQAQELESQRAQTAKLQAQLTAAAHALLS